MITVKDKYTREDITELIESPTCAFYGQNCEKCPICINGTICSDFTTEDVSMIMKRINSADTNTIKFAAVDKSKEYKIPTKRIEDAGYDIYVSIPKGDFIKIHAHKTVLVSTNIATAIPFGYYFQVEERGSTGSKGIKKSAGVIDSGYRGEIFIAITNTNEMPIVIAHESTFESEESLSTNCICYPAEKAIAQLVLHEVPQLESEEISYEELKEIPSERGNGALGSSGK